MSGGSYNYLYCHAAGLEAQRGDIEAMRNRLQGLANRDVPGAARAVADTQAVLDHFDQAETKAQALTDVWHAVEWWDSSDWSEDDVHDALAKHHGATQDGATASPTEVVTMGADRPTPRQVVMAELQGVDPIAFVAMREKVADQLLAAITDRMRVEVGPSDCGCGGCDACCQQALIDWLDPR